MKTMLRMQERQFRPTMIETTLGEAEEVAGEHNVEKKKGEMKVRRGMNDEGGRTKGE